LFAIFKKYSYIYLHILLNIKTRFLVLQHNIKKSRIERKIKGQREREKERKKQEELFIFEL